jgi:hypothetical protein
MSNSTMHSGYSSTSNSAEMGEYRGCFYASIEDPGFLSPTPRGQCLEIREPQLCSTTPIHRFTAGFPTAS